MNHTQHCIQDTSSCPPLRCRDLREARDFLTILLPHSQGILDTRWRSGKILSHQLSHTFHTDTRRTSRKGSSASGGIGRTWKKGTEKGGDEFHLSHFQYCGAWLIDLNKNTWIVISSPSLISVCARRTILCPFSAEAILSNEEESLEMRIELYLWMCCGITGHNQFVE